MSTYGIAAGHNAANPTALHRLSGELFWRYEAGIDDSWFQVREIAGDHSIRLIGRPSVQWVFPQLRKKEFEYLRSTFWPTADHADLTIRTPNRAKAANPFERCNVRGYWLDFSNGSLEILRFGVWENATLEFVDLVSLGT